MKPDGRTAHVHKCRQLPKVHQIFKVQVYSAMCTIYVENDQDIYTNWDLRFSKRKRDHVLSRVAHELLTQQPVGREPEDFFQKRSCEAFVNLQVQLRRIWVCESAHRSKQRVLWGWRNCREFSSMSPSERNADNTFLKSATGAVRSDTHTRAACF